MVKLHKDPVGDLGDAVVTFRDNAYAVVRERWVFGSFATAANLAISYDNRELVDQGLQELGKGNEGAPS